MAAAGAREPTPDPIAGWNGMADVALWANLKGDALDPATQAGSLLLATDAVEDGELCSIAEFAAMDPDAFLDSILGWTYCEGTGATVQPGPVLLGKARSMLRGARLATGVDWTKAASDAYDQKITDTAERSWHSFVQQTSTAGAVASPHAATTEAVNILIAQRVDEITKSRTDHVNLAEVVGHTKKREVAVMTADAYDECWNRFAAAKQRPPLPEE